jgi:hypothetical protein
VYEARHLGRPLKTLTLALSQWERGLIGGMLAKYADLILLL